MGRGDNRSTPKMRQRKARKRLKLRLRKKIEGSKSATAKPATTAAKKK